MSNITAKEINDLRNDYQVKKALYEKAQLQNDENIAVIRDHLISITAEEVSLANSLGIEIGRILNVNLELLKTNKEYYEGFCSKVQNAIEVVFEDAKKKLGEV